MTQPLIIAFDGPAASGKGTLASVIAADYSLPFLDTGLLYRAAGHLAHVLGIDPAQAAQRITPELLNDEALRGREAGERASQVAAIPAVRAALKQFQIDFAHQPSGAVLDGRDIGTVIAPDATVKLFVTATPEIRAERRWKQLVKLNPALTFDEVLSDIRIRDARDSGRADAPLEKAGDALLLDTSDLGIEAAIAAARSLVKDRCGDN
ncbi:cytidylate kinase [Asticcacaulis biprosthecium C19]|uniref:Cytidylate kinase n=1 Tax=Asticcacaulis biprosthecium C19 TaxID=715226 RepID=F4QIN7_9CAUL|nr:(d)CMP kinase [Asticcacaulis biprosthecium]EGF91796.1 cytidylate kinase [Asticcacaulis biprosthecium C19]